MLLEEEPVTALIVRCRSLPSLAAAIRGTGLNKAGLFIRSGPIDLASLSRINPWIAITRSRFIFFLLSPRNAAGQATSVTVLYAVER